MSLASGETIAAASDALQAAGRGQAGQPAPVDAMRGRISRGDDSLFARQLNQRLSIGGISYESNSIYLCVFVKVLMRRVNLIDSPTARVGLITSR